MKKDIYLEATRLIPSGETRSFRELATLAGKPAAARAAGRAVAACPAGERCAWHRVVAADGSLSHDPNRAVTQIERLRREGARPRDGEAIARWAKRRRFECIANWKTKRFATREDPCVLEWPADRVEGVHNAESALARGFRPIVVDAGVLDAGVVDAGAVKDARFAGNAKDAGPSKARPRKRKAVDPEASRPPRVASNRSAPRRSGSNRARSTDARSTNTGPTNTGPTDIGPNVGQDIGVTLAATKSSRARARSSLRFEPPSADVEERLERVDWSVAKEELALSGAFTIEGLLDARRCTALRDLFTASELFERTIDMAPRGYGIGTYRYFKEPLPEPAYTIREEIYTHLLDLARGSRSAPDYPASLAEFFERCRAAGQRRSSSILISYAAGGVNHPHRDIYGKLWFPYQAVLVLSAREKEFEGGDLLLCTRASDGTEERRALPLDQGDLCLFASRGFEATARRGASVDDAALGPRTQSRRPARRPLSRPDARWVDQTHGLSTVTRGERFALGLVLHLAE